MITHTHTHICAIHYRLDTPLGQQTHLPSTPSLLCPSRYQIWLTLSQPQLFSEHIFWTPPNRSPCPAEEHAFRKRRLCIKFIPRDSTEAAICDIRILGRSRQAPPQYTFIGWAAGALYLSKVVSVPSGTGFSCAVLCLQHTYLEFLVCNENKTKKDKRMVIKWWC